MKKELSAFLCTAAVMFFGSCSDLSMNDEEAVKADLPKDFDWAVYADINNDVKMSQIIFDVRERNKEYGKGTDSTSRAVERCVDILRNEDFAEKVYLEYVGCPKDGWNKNEKCSGKYANNSSYEKKTVNGDDTTYTCIIRNCWHGDWGELTDSILWQDSLTSYLNTSGRVGAQGVDPKNVIKAMCLFIPPASKAETSSDVLGYFNNIKSNLNSYLIEKSYLVFGRYDGRAYKYCDPGSIDREKTRDLARLNQEGRTDFIYDYGAHTFCFNKADDKIYVIK